MFEDAVTAWYAVERRYPGAILKHGRVQSAGILAMHDLTDLGAVKVKAGRRIVACIIKCA